MVIKSCVHCKQHEIGLEGKEQMSYCRKENCWSQFSKCLAKEALRRFLEHETPKADELISTR
jgi:hypothetical protein